MIGKYHNHSLQTNPLHHETEPQNNNNHKTPGRQRKVKHSEAHFFGVKILFIFYFFIIIFSIFFEGRSRAVLRGHF